LQKQPTFGFVTIHIAFLIRITSFLLKVTICCEAVDKAAFRSNTRTRTFHAGKICRTALPIEVSALTGLVANAPKRLNPLAGGFGEYFAAQALACLQDVRLRFRQRCVTECLACHKGEA
jgi:hypothetical protein